MNLDDTMTFTVTTADDFGDDVAHRVRDDCAVEQASAFASGVNAELQTGDIVAWIDPSSDIWTDKGLARLGMTEDHKGTQYRVAGELPAAGSAAIRNLRPNWRWLGGRPTERCSMMLRSPTTTSSPPWSASIATCTDQIRPMYAVRPS